MSDSDMSATQQDRPDYDVEIDADELLTDIAEMAAEYGEDYEEKRRWWMESPPHDEFVAARGWMQEAAGGQLALSHVVAALQPENHSLMVDCHRREDGTVNVRELMAWLSEQADAAHERSGNSLNPNRQANEAETAYVSVLSLLRDDYGVGWPRLDDVGGNPLEEDLP